MRSDLRKAIRGVLVGDAALVALATGGIHLGTVPDRTEMPYLAYSAPGLIGKPDRTTGGQQIEELNIRVQVWANDADTAAAIIERAEALLLAHSVSLEYTQMNATKLDADVFQETDRDQAADEVWQGVMTMELMIHWNPRA